MQLKRVFGALLLGAMLVACAGHSSSFLPTAAPMSGNAIDSRDAFDSSDASDVAGDDAGMDVSPDELVDGEGNDADLTADGATTGTIVLHIKVPGHAVLKGRPAGIVAPEWLSRGTESLSVLVKGAKHKTVAKALYVLSKKTKGCKGGKVTGTKVSALTCTFTLAVPAGKVVIKLTGLDGTKKKSKAIELISLKKTIKAGKATKIKVSMYGEIYGLMLWLSNAYPAAGTPSSIVVRAIGADRWGYVIAGTYDKPMTFTGSTNGATLSATTVAQSTQAAKLLLSYSGATLKPIVFTVRSATTKNSSSAVFAPGASGGLVANPAGLFVGPKGAVVTLSAYGTARAPFSMSMTADAIGDPPCNGLVTVGGTSPIFVVKPKAVGVCALLASDTAGHTLAIPVLVQVDTTGDPSPLPSTSPTTGPSTSPSGSPSPSPSPSPTPPQVTANPPTVAMCPSSGPNSCSPFSRTLQISQNTFTSNFGESDTCDHTLVTITPVSTVGPTASYTVASVGSAYTTCKATFTGGFSQSVDVKIEVDSGGVVINEPPISSLPESTHP